jgi:hypothetical protein
MMYSISLVVVLALLGSANPSSPVVSSFDFF